MSELLKIRELTKRFGGIVAVNKVSFEVREGETLGFIGPNGAGKSTVVNCLTGYLMPDEGEIEMDGKNITRMPPHERTHLGLSRTYQIPRPFPELTALASVVTSALCGKKTGQPELRGRHGGGYALSRVRGPFQQTQYPGPRPDLL